MSTRELAEKITATGVRVNHSGISCIEQGRIGSATDRFPAVTVDQLMAFAQVFGCTAERLLAEVTCVRCNGAPPPGFTCNECGQTGA
jgi:hypothetical protein